MRVVGGADRGRRLAASRGLGTRPTAERVREALFDILGPAVEGMRVLDLCAGTGAVGIEALSRGAAFACFVERERDALRALRSNLERLGVAADRSRIVAGDVLATLPVVDRTEAPFDLVFVDPPYAGPLTAAALAALARSALLAPGGRLVVQHLAKTPVTPPAGLRLAGRARRFGTTALTFFQAEGYTPAASRP
jgi:16S rRNA (guanine966-N2)-methyltransferase